MKLFILSTGATLLLVAATLCFSADAFPQKARVQRVPYHPPPTRAPRPIRFRRQAIGGQVSSNPAGGSDVRMEIAKGFGTPDHNVIGSAFAAGNTDRGPVTTGGSVAYNNNGHGLALTKEHIPGVRDSFTQSARANLFNDGTNKIDANAFASQNKLPNGFEFQRNGGGLSWANANGHGANAGISNIPGFGRQLDLGGKANLWSSPDRNTMLDLNAGASRWLSGPLGGQTNYGGGLGLTHMFG